MSAASFIVRARAGFVGGLQSMGRSVRGRGACALLLAGLMALLATPLAAAPTLTVTAPADGALVATPTVDVSGTASDPDLASVTVNGLVASLSADSWLVRGVPLAEGSTTLLVRAENGSGDFTEVSRTVVLDSTDPGVTVSDPAPGTVVPGDTYLLRGSATDPHLLRVEVTTPNATVAATVNGDSWERTVTLVEGNNTFTVVAFDTLGHRGETMIALVRDSEAPSVQITAPEDGLRTAQATVDVAGTVDPELVDGTPTVSVTVGGVATSVQPDGSFTLAGVALNEGENRLTARATDALGNQGTHTRDVVLDTMAPSFVGSQPPSGALAVEVVARFEVDFDEAMATPAAGSWRLETVDPDTGSVTPLAADAVVGDTQLVVTPATDLPSQATVHLVLTSTLTDLAGNALITESAGETVLSITTADASAPSTPTVDPVPALVCAASWTLAGTAETGSTVRVHGGASLAEVAVGEDGTFTLAIDLAEGSNHLEVTAADGAGNASPAVAVEITRDCQPPVVTSASLTGNGVAVTLSEPVTQASIGSRLWLEDGSGALAGSVSLGPAGDTATFAASASLPGGPLRVVVAAGVEDRAGNALTSDYAQLLGAGTADSFVAGTALDAATGRPLAGVRVVATARDGVALADPKPEVTTAGDGRFLLSLPAGTHELTMAREGFSPAFRRVTTAPDGGVEVYAPRLTPVGAVATTDSGATTVGLADGSGSTLELPSGALPQGTAVTLTDLGAQDLPVVLPYGWSPRGATWIDLGAALASEATLELAVTAPVGEVLELAGLDLATLTWRALPATEVVDPVVASTQTVRLRLPVSSEVAAVAAVAADTGPMAPPAPVAGTALGSGPTPLGGEVSAATLGFDPPVVLPTQRSRVQVDYTVDGPLASGAPLTLRVAETLETASGSQPGAAFEVDLRLFHDSTGEPGSRFWLQPSDLAASIALVSGEARVEVHPWAGSGSSGGVVDPTGGTVTSAEGDRLEIPAGALAAPAAVTLARRTVADLPVAPPSEGTVVGVLEVDLEGGELLLPARMVFAADPPPTAGSRGLLLQVVEVLGAPRYRLVAEVEATAQGWATATIDPLDLPWPGVRSSGLYAILDPNVDLGFARGTVLGIDGVTPVGGVVVEASLGAALGGPLVSWLQISSADGAYALAVPAAEALVLVASEPTSGDGVAVVEAAFAVDERRDRDLALLPVGPEVLDLVPAPGAVDVPLGIEPTVTFTEAIDPSTVDAIELLVDGAPWPVDPVVEGALVRLLPQASLPAGTEVTLRVGLGVRDLQGHPTPNPVTATFTTASDSGSAAVDRRRIRLIAPDAAGQVQVLGLSGAVPSGTTVFVENQTSFSTTETVTAAQDGSFALSLAASLTDRLLLRAVLPDGEDVFLVLGPFLSADQRSALVGSESVVFTTGDGVTVYVPAEAVTNPGWIRLALEPATNRPVEMPGDLTPLFDLAVDLGDVVLREPLGVELPAPGGLTGGPLLLMRSHEAFGRRGWMLHDLLRVEGSVLTTAPVGTLAALRGPVDLAKRSSTADSVESEPGVVFPGAGAPRLLSPEQMAALSRPQAGSVRVLPAVPRRAPRLAPRPTQQPEARTDAVGGSTLAERTSTGDVQALLQGVGHSGHYTGVESQVDLAYVQLPVVSGLNAVAFSDSFGLVPMVADSSVALEGRIVTRLVLPSRLGESYTLEVRNLRSGYELFNQLMAPPNEEFVELSPTLLRDDDAPVVVDGTPLGFHLLQTFADGTWSVAPGVTLTVAGANATLTGDLDAVDPEATVRVVAVDGIGSSQMTVASIHGSFSLQFTTAPGARHLLGLGGAVRSSSALELSFSEALGDDLSALRVERQRAGTNVWDAVVLDKTPVGSREVLRLQPSHGWQPGDYRLVIAAGLPDRMVPPNTTNWSFTLPFTVEGVTSIGGGVDVGPVRDLARLGSLLFVAGDNGVGIYDVSDPRQPQPYLPGNLQMPFPNQAAVRGLTVDTHGRVLAVGGGAMTFGQLRMLDVTALDRGAIATDPDARLAGWRGTSLLTEIGTNNTVPQLVSGTPRRVAVLPNEGVLGFAFDQELPGGLAYTPSAPATGELAYRATLASASLLAGPNQAVTLHNRSRGTWHRLDADGSGSFSFTLRVEPHPLAQGDSLAAGVEPDLTVAPGERLELAIDQGGLAYVTLDGAGMAVVDLGSVYGESIDTPNHPALSDVLAYVPPFQIDTSVPCDIGAPLVSGQPTDVGVLVDPANPEPLVVPVLLERYGVALYRAADSESPADLVALGQICGAVEGTARLTSMEVVAGYPLAVDTDGDGVVEEATPRDLILATHGAGHVLAFDVTDRAAPVRLGRVRLPGHAAALSVDRANRTLLVAGEAGFAVVRLDEVWGELEVDVDGDGRDDRVVEWVTLGSEATGILASAELGLAWLGSNDVDADGVTLRGLSLSAPQVNLVSAAPGIPQAVSRVAPLGVPTASPGGITLPAWVRLQAVVPPALASSIGGGTGDLPFDLVSQGPGGLEIDGLSPVDGVTLPTTALRDMALRRQGRHPWEQGYGLFVSDPVVLLADLRAMAAYDRTPLEDSVCRRCDVHAEGIYPGNALPSVANRWQELLSGHQLAARWPADLRVALSEIYTGAMLDAAEVTVDSVPWDLSPTPRQEPTLNPSLGTGDVAPGTLLHSGEFSHQVTDVAVPGRGGLDLAFTRTYRSQSISDGPLGLGWDHAFRARLRPLPNGDVDFFDGRGRRETFEALPAGQFRPPAGRFVWLKRTTLGWQMQDAGGTNLLFDRWGRLSAIFDPFNDRENEGTRLSLTYDSASRLTGVSTHGRYLAFTYNDEGRITEIADHSGRVFQLGYDPEGRLTDSTTPAVLTGPSEFPEGITTVCEYEPIGTDDDTVAEKLNRRDNMTVLSQPYDASDAGLRLDWLELGYSHLGDTGHFVTQQTWGGDGLSIVYDFAAQTAIVRDRRQHDATYTHTPEGHLKTFLDRAGHTTTWNYGVYPELEHGLVREVILANGRTTRYEYTQEAEPAAGRRFRELANVARRILKPSPTEVPAGVPQPPNLPSEIVTSLADFDPTTNQPSLVLDGEGRSTAVAHDEDGHPQAVEQDFAAPIGTSLPDQVAMTRSVPNLFGEVKTRRQIRPTADDFIVSMEYETEAPRAGFPARQVIDPQGLALTTQIETDARGNVIRVIDPRGIQHEFEYNELDWLVEARQGTVTGDPSLPPVGSSARYHYDSRGNTIAVERGLGVVGSSEFSRSETTYDELNLPLVSRREVGDGTWVEERREYDPNRNLVEFYGPTAERITWSYDDRNLPMEQIAHRSGANSSSPTVEERYEYDEVGQLVRRHVGGLSTGEPANPGDDAYDQTWETIYDGYGRVYRQIDGEGHYREQHYDDSHNPVWASAADKDGTLLARTELVYDGGNRLVEERRWLQEDGGNDTTQVSTYLYDELSLLRQVTDGRGLNAIYDYDSALRQVGVFDQQTGFGNARILDAAGNVIEEHERIGFDPWVSNISRFYEYDALNRAVAHVDGEGRRWSATLDVRGNPLRTETPDGAVTSYRWDSLDRMLEKTQPEGLREQWAYDPSSRVLQYVDARGQTTSRTYTDLGELALITYPDLTSESYRYDDEGHLVETIQATGTTVAADYDRRGLLETRTILRGSSVAGVTSEAYEIDGLGRVTRSVSEEEAAQAGRLVEAVSSWRYDTLSRPIQQSQLGHSLGMGYDLANNPTTLDYPAGFDIERTFDRLNRLGSVTGVGGASAIAVASYGYQGLHALATRQVRDFLGTLDVDVSGRPLGVDYPGVFEETLSWNARGLLEGQSRADLNGASKSHTYDPVGRLVANGWTGGSPPGGAVDWSFAYDTAQNLTEQRATESGVSAVLEYTVDSRNRPAEVNGQALTWDARGNLTAKGDLRFAYDFRNRLVEVQRFSNGEVLASYAYDTENRRIHRQIHDETGGAPSKRTFETLWDGWQAVAEYELVDDGQGGSTPRLVGRRIYGRGLDEIVSFEHAVGNSLETLVPFYDALGNVALMADLTGRVVERYEYSPYGERRIFVDGTAPVVDQIRRDGDGLVLELSEAVRADNLIDAVASGDLSWTHLGQGQQVPYALSLESGTSRSAYRVWRLTPREPEPGETDLSPQPGDLVELSIAAPVLEDLFGNTPASSQTWTITWPNGDALIEDGTPPRVEQILVTASGHLELEFSERVDSASLASIAVDGASISWSEILGGRVARSQSALAAGAHTVQLGSGVVDQAGLPLSELISESFAVAAGEARWVHRGLIAQEIEASTIDNPFGFKGLPLDKWTGFYYVRNRYYDPELDRFITPDPLGYVDGPSMYQFAMNDPVNYSDPMGLESAEIYQRQRDMRLLDPETRDAELASREASRAQAARVLGNPYVQGGLQMAGGCLEAGVGGFAVATGVGTLPGAIAVLHGADLCLIGLGTMLTGEVQESLFTTSVRSGLISAGMDPAYAQWTTVALDLGVGVGAMTGVGLSRMFDDLGDTVAVAITQGAREGIEGVVPRGIGRSGAQPIGSVLSGAGQLRRVGEFLESIDDALENPQLLRNLNPAGLQLRIGGRIPSGWRIETLGQGAHKGQGFVLRQYTPQGYKTGRQIRWHPGGGHHGPDPYWRSINANTKSGIIPGAPWLR